MENNALTDAERAAPSSDPFAYARWLAATMKQQYPRGDTRAEPSMGHCAACEMEKLLAAVDRLTGAPRTEEQGLATAEAKAMASKDTSEGGEDSPAPASHAALLAEAEKWIATLSDDILYTDVAEFIDRLSAALRESEEKLQARTDSRDACERVNVRLHSAVAAAEAERERLREALQKIVVCECRFRVDPLEHAREAVEYCQEIARAALAPTDGGGA